MKKIIAFILTLFMLASITACNNQTHNNTNNNSNESIVYIAKDTTENSKKLNLQYSGYDEIISWELISYNDTYTVTLDQNEPIELHNSFYPTARLDIGYHKITVKTFIDNSNTIEETLEFIIKGIDENDIKEAEEELCSSIVRVKIKCYNTTLGIIKSDEASEEVQGTLCKQNESTYWAVCYSKLLNSSANYDKTEITIKDKYGNEYDGTEITPTNIEDRILNVISFKSKNELSAVKFATNLCDSTYLLDVDITRNPTSIIRKLVGTEGRTTINGKSTKKPVVKINSTIATNGNAIFNSNFELVGIIIPNDENKIAFIQVKEIFLYIDKDLATQCIEWK